MHFKDPQNRVHYLEHADHAHLLPAGCVPITDGEAAALVAPTPEQVAAAQAAAAQAAADATALAAAKADTVVQYLRDHTPAEVESYIQTNVTDLASARQMLKKFGVALCVLARREFR